MFSSRLKKIFAYILIGLTSVGLITAGITFAWLSDAIKGFNIPANGNVILKYFYSGNGTENNPFTIKDPVHFNNLTELYARHDSFYTQDYYFELIDDIDMSEYATYRPIGSETKPFGGKFNGNGYTVENINVTADHSETDIGIFGYVNSDAEIKDVYFDHVNIDVSGATETSTNNHSNNAYVGYIAGHIDDATKFENVYVNNCSIDKSSCEIHNDWGYFGYCDNAATIDKFITTAQAGHAHGSDWGGSIDFKEFNTRFYNRRNDFSYSTNKRLAKYETNYTKASLAYGSNLQTSILNKDPTTNGDNIVYNLQGSGSHTIGDTYTLVGTAMPISIDDNGVTSDSNTGYIVSSSRSTSGSANGAVRTASYKNGRINNSLSDTARTPREVYLNAEMLTYDSSKTEILTNKNKEYNANGSGTTNFALIKDSYNSGHTPSNSNISGYTKNDTTVPGSNGLDLKKYDSSRQNLDGILSGTKKVQGIHFMNATIAANNTETLPIVKINKKTYDNSSYPLLKNCIDFNTKESGIINFFGGTYYDHSERINNSNVTVSSADCFFSLYEVDRDETTHTINDVKLLSKIYKDTRNTKNYIYQYSDNTYSDDSTYLGDVAFDMRFLSETPPVQNAIYYFEIPVNKGEFALGGVSGHDGGAYLLYLDISASGSNPAEQKVDDFTSVEYRSASETTLHSILILRYVIADNEELYISVLYDPSKKYYITAVSNDTITIQIAILDTEYQYYFRNTENGSYTELDNSTVHLDSTQHT